jgi:dienelactone hydrolase
MVQSFSRVSTYSNGLIGSIGDELGKRGGGSMFVRNGSLRTVTLVPVMAVMAVLSVLSLAGQAGARALDSLEPAEVQRRLGELQHLRVHLRPTEMEDGTHGDCAKTRVSLQVMDPKRFGVSFVFDLTVIRPLNAKGPMPVMILIPTIEGITRVEQKLATNFCDMRVASIIADVNDNTEPNEYPAWGLEDQRNRMAIFALRTIIDYARNHPSFNPDKIGMMGSSLGGIIASFIAGMESERLAAVVTVVAGGNIPFILSKSDNKHVAKIREGRMKHAQVSSAEEYENRLRETVRYDPMYFAFSGRTDRMLMVMSTGDSKVPSEMQLELHRAFGKPKESMFTVGHVGTILGIAYMYFDTVGKFLREKMALPNFDRPFTPVAIPPDAADELKCLL